VYECYFCKKHCATTGIKYARCNKCGTRNNLKGVKIIGRIDKENAVALNMMNVPRQIREPILRKWNQP